MTGQTAQPLTPASLLCQACGLCCTGHLFIWVKLRPAELDPAEALGLPVLRADPNQRGFNQPCPLWQGQCTIYSSKNYPHACRAYKCRVLKQLIADENTLPAALETIEQARAQISKLETRLTASRSLNFRERVVALVEHPEQFPTLTPELHRQAAELLTFFETVFGLNDLLEKPLDQDPR